MKKTIIILLSIIFIFTNTPYTYTQPKTLASRSLFKLWREKGFDPTTGLIIEARLKALHESILRNRYNSATLEAVDKMVLGEHLEILSKYPFNYNITTSGDKRVFYMQANLYKDKYGEEQLVLFYNPENPPWDILEQFGVKTPEDKEFAERGYWITSVETYRGMTRRVFLTLFGLGALFLPACVFNTSGLSDLRDGGAGTDSGVIPDGGTRTSIEQQIDAVIDNNDNSVTILPTSIYTGEDVTQRLSPLQQFVRRNNAAFRYNGKIWYWALSDLDRGSIINNGFSYIYNGRDHRVRLIGRDMVGQTKTIIFNPQITGRTDYNQPYRITISAELIRQLAQQIGLILDTIDLYFENQVPEEELVINGFKRLYAVVATSGEVAPDKIGPQWSPFNIGGATINTVPTLEGVNIGFTMTGGDNGQSVGINIQTKSGGIPLSDPDLQGAWKMDGPDLGTDSGPNGNSLTNNGGVESVPGRYGNAISLSGGNYLSIDSPTGLEGGTSEQTIVAWVKTTTVGGTIVSKWANINGGGYAYNIQESRLIFYYGATGDVFHNLHADIPINDDTWHHTAAVVDGSTVRLYVDGVEVKTGPQEIPLGFNNLDPFMIGQNANYNWPFNGLIDEVAVFDRALTSDEIQGIYNRVDSSNFLTPALITAELNVRGNSPFILQLTDNNGQILDIFILGLDPADWRGIAIDILQAQAVINPSFNLNNVESVKILVQDTILPVQDGQSFNGAIEIEGFIGIPPPTTRHRYATDEHDIDVTQKDYKYLVDNLGRAKLKMLERKGRTSVIGVEEWMDDKENNILLQNGLGFTAGGRFYSAFTVKGGRENLIYIPHPDLVKSSLGIEDNYIRGKILNSIQTRNSIILSHEIDEINEIDHREAVFNEFSTNSINGLNYADVVTVLLETLSIGDIIIIDEEFHRKFIANLLIQGMFLDNEGNTYVKIIKEVLDDRIDEDRLRELYRKILAEITGLVSSYRFTHRRLSEKETIIPDIELEKEPGFTELFNVIKELRETGTIYIDMARFFVENKSLAAEDVVSTIDFEYLKRFAAFVRRLQGTKVRVKGIYGKNRQRTELIEQLTSIIREDFGLNNEQFPIDVVDFTNYLEFIEVQGNVQSTVSILTEYSWSDIPLSNRGQLKIVDSHKHGYNRANSSGWEFYTALKGLSYDTPQRFLAFIIAEVLQQLVNQRIITQDEASSLRDQIERHGIAFIPTYYDPIIYYKTIESQKSLLTAA